MGDYIPLFYMDIITYSYPNAESGFVNFFQ